MYAVHDQNFFYKMIHERKPVILKRDDLITVTVFLGIMAFFIKTEIHAHRTAASPAKNQMTRKRPLVTMMEFFLCNLSSTYIYKNVCLTRTLNHAKLFYVNIVEKKIWNQV